MTFAPPTSLNLMRYHGGKGRIASWVQSFLGEHRIYVEACGGSGSVLLNKPRSPVEVFNDLDSEVVNLFRVLRCPEQSQRLRNQIDLTPYAREEYMLSRQPHPDPLEQARRTLVRAYMAYGGLFTGRYTGFRADPSPSTGRTAHQWADLSEVLDRVTDRLQSVIVENLCALDLVPSWDGPDTVVYLDPPYVPEQRTGAGYRHEMDNPQHISLVGMCCGLQARVVLSGYRNSLYDAMLQGWEAHDREGVGTLRGEIKKTETVWVKSAGVQIPFDATLYSPQLSLF